MEFFQKCVSIGIIHEHSSLADILVLYLILYRWHEVDYAPTDLLIVLFWQGLIIWEEAALQ